MQSIESWKEKAEDKNPTWQEATEELVTTLLSEEPMPKILQQKENLTPNESNQPTTVHNKQSESENQDIYRQKTEIQTETEVFSASQLDSQSQKTFEPHEAHQAKNCGSLRNCVVVSRLVGWWVGGLVSWVALLLAFNANKVTQ